MAAIFGEGKIFGKLQRVHSLDTLWVKNSVQIALSLTVSEILRFFRFSQKFKMAAKNFQYSSTTLWVKNRVEIALSLTVSEILRFFHFSQKIKMAAKSGENWNFLNRSISYGFWDIKIFLFFAKIQDGRQKFSILFYYPVSQKSCRNRSISYGFRDIKILSFFAKN